MLTCIGSVAGRMAHSTVNISTRATTATATADVVPTLYTFGGVVFNHTVSLQQLSNALWMCRFDATAVHCTWAMTGPTQANTAADW